MLISLSRRRRHKKQRSPDSQHRSIFLKMLFGIISGDYGNKLMAMFAKGDPAFEEEWTKVAQSVITKSKEVKSNEEENEN